jgi:hypothetical protein
VTARLESLTAGRFTAAPHVQEYRNASGASPLHSRWGCSNVLAGRGAYMIIRLLLAAAIAGPCAGCASVTRGTTENISISSTPAGATAEVTGLEVPTACVTPCVVQAKRNADITVTVNKEGYEPQIIQLTKKSPAVARRVSRAMFCSAAWSGWASMPPPAPQWITSRIRSS